MICEPVLSDEGNDPPPLLRVEAGTPKLFVLAEGLLLGRVLDAEGAVLCRLFPFPDGFLTIWPVSLLMKIVLPVAGSTKEEKPLWGFRV